jgi:hypothetical protein
MAPKPKITADLRTIDILKGLGRIQCTTKELAATFGVTEPTIFLLFKRSPACKEAYEGGKEVGKASLRRTQFRLAEKNAAMAIFLGKNYLGQTDRQELNSGEGNGGVQTVVIYGGAPPKPAGYED